MVETNVMIIQLTGSSTSKHPNTRMKYRTAPPQRALCVLVISQQPPKYYADQITDYQNKYRLR